jgi:chromosome segregation protein
MKAMEEDMKDFHILVQVKGIEKFINETKEAFMEEINKKDSIQKKIARRVDNKGEQPWSDLVECHETIIRYKDQFYDNYIFTEYAKVKLMREVDLKMLGHDVVEMKVKERMHQERRQHQNELIERVDNAIKEEKKKLTASYTQEIQDLNTKFNKESKNSLLNKNCHPSEIKSFIGEEHEEKTQEMKEDLEKKLKDTEDNFKEIKSQKKAISKKLKDTEKDLRSAQELIEGLTNKAKDLEEKNKVSNEENNELKKDKVTLQNCEKALKDSNLLFEGHLEKKEQRIQKLKEKKKNLKSELDEANKANEDLQQKVAGLVTDLDQSKQKEKDLSKKASFCCIFIIL